MECHGFAPEDYGMFALGTLAPSPELKQIAEHVSLDCPVCLTNLRASREVWTAVGAATRIVQPHRSLRRRVVQAVGGSAHWWASWQPLPILAGLALLLLTAGGGWFVGLRRTEAPQIAFAPVYRLSVPEFPPSPERMPAQIITKMKEVPVADPAIAQALALERQKSAQLETDLVQQRTLVANAQQAAQESDRRYQAAREQISGADEVQKRLATATARTQELERQVAQYRVLLEVQRKRIEQNLQLASLTNMLSDPSFRVIRLRGTEKGEKIEGHAVIAGGSQMVFYASQLPALPPNRTYQLWLIRPTGKAIASAGTFVPDGSSHAVVQLKDPALLSAVNTLSVTDEPLGGSAQPTGHKWMIGI
jgi:hypothetical protein